MKRSEFIVFGGTAGGLAALRARTAASNGGDRVPQPHITRPSVLRESRAFIGWPARRNDMLPPRDPNDDDEDNDKDKEDEDEQEEGPAVIREPDE